MLFAQKYIAHFGNHPVYGQKVKVCLPFACNLFIHVCVDLQGEVNIKFSLIQDFMSLLAYKDPLESPMSGLVGEDFRQQVLESLNLAILGWLTSIYFVLSHAKYDILLSLSYFLFW